MYAPDPGLHPGLPPLDPLVIEWSAAARKQRVELWSWRPAGGAYAGMPADADDAAVRRSERVVIETGAGAIDAAGLAWWPQPQPFTVDLRRG